MCILCDKGFPQKHTRSQLGRRDFLKTTAAGGAAAGLGLFAARPAAATPVAVAAFRKSRRPSCDPAWSCGFPSSHSLHMVLSLL